MANISLAAPSWRRSWAISSSRRSSTSRSDMEHPALFSTCAFFMLMLILSWVGYRLVYKPGKFMHQLGSPVITNDSQRLTEGFGERAAGFLWPAHRDHFADARVVHHARGQDAA